MSIASNFPFERLTNRINYFGDNSSLHGVRNIFSAKSISYFKRSIWIVFICLSCFGMTYILKQGTKLFEEEAISFVPETTYLHWNTDFPAITICETVDNDKLRDYYEENDVPIKLTSFYKEIIFLDSQHYCRNCAKCKDMNCPVDFKNIIKTYRSPCNETIVRCSWKGQIFQCCERFLVMETEYGECFVFNSRQTDSNRIHISNRITGPGYLEFAAMETVMIDIHHPDDVIFSNFDKQIINGNEGDLPFGSEFKLRFAVEETSNDEAVQGVAAAIRGCLFADEGARLQRLYPRYSHSACVVRCRARRQLATCGCTHHMLPRMGAEPICNITGLICLTDLAEAHPEEEDIDSLCGCLPSCEEPKYNTIYMKKTLNTGELTDELIERGTIISIYMECLPTTKIKRLLIRSSLDYVVFVGGTAGIFFGASILSLIEIFYLMFIRKFHA